MELRNAVIVDAVRSANGRASKGSLIHTRADNLLAHIVRSLLERNPDVPKNEIEDVIVGCSMPESEQGMNIGRQVALLADLPVEVPGVTVNRFCASSAEGAHMAARSIMTGCGDIFVVGGVESLSHVPMGGFNNDKALNPDLFMKQMIWSMTQTAQNVHEDYNTSREEMDAFTARSHKKAAAATEAGAFKNEIIPVEVPKTEWVEDENGKKQPKKLKEKAIFERDECIRPGTTAQKLAELDPIPGVFSLSGKPVQITAGNSCPLTDGAAALLIMEEQKARALGYSRFARIRGMAVAGVHPKVMGIGPIPSSNKALERAGVQMSDVELVELNEAFASQAIVSIRELGMNEEIVNVRGGALALGHPLGQSGARLLGSLFHGLLSDGKGLGLQTMCVGGGQGVATVLELI